ncbi:uncharacterized protein PAC_00534 [Phialocephala subalpina]|uniref:Dienelactone hydrolase domain-containing protein n=1 Tax=Phialocephala subalpina TaxID=576137 RepID=A0A1L7WD04_9HELO|nr:uncharacterized protein PAC_00534 [Phialocephala subalpina]
MSTGVGMSECCLSGRLVENHHKVEDRTKNLKVTEGTPTRKIETIAIFKLTSQLQSTDPRQNPSCFLSTNVRLLAGNYAKAGFYCYVPDVHRGDSLPLEFLNSVEPPLKTREHLSMIDKTKNTATVGTTLPAWLVKQREAVSKPLIDSFINAVRQIPGTGKVGAIGFFWGGRYAILAAHGEVDAAYACHPPLVAIPGDFEPVTKPLSLAVGDKDSLLDNETCPDSRLDGEEDRPASRIENLLKRSRAPKELGSSTPQHPLKPLTNYL